MKSQLRKLSIACLLAGSTLSTHSAWAWGCNNPSATPAVSGYDYVGCLSEGLAGVEQNGKWGFVDKTGKVVIPLKYDDIGTNFSEGLAAVVQNGKYGYIDTNGKTVLDFKYESADIFKNGRAMVSFGDDGKSPKRLYIDKTGKILANRISLTDFRKKLEQGDDVQYETRDGSGRGMILDIKGNLVQIQTKESQCSQRDYNGLCKNYIDNQVSKWVKRTEVYPKDHDPYNE